MFASSRNVAKLADFEKPATPLTEANLAEEQEGQRSGSRFFGDKNNRKSLGAGESEGRHNRESWTTARERRQAEENDTGERGPRFGRKDQGGERRNGFGDKHDSRWGPREDRAQNGERRGGWRDRERERRDRDFDRGHEKEPEWMDDPAPKQQGEDLSTMSMPKNQEDFEKWKQAQHARNKKSTSEVQPEAVAPEGPPEPTEMATAKPSAAPLKLDAVMGSPFGSLSSFGRPESANEGAPTPAKTGTVKGGKKSRFMPMFSKEESREETPSAPEPPPAAPGANGSSEDKEGFQRILQMLGGANISQAPTPTEPSSPAPRQAFNGTAKRRSRFTGFFDQTPKSPERIQSPPEAQNHTPFNPMDREMAQSGHGMTPEPGGMFGGRLPGQQHQAKPSRPQPPPSMISPEPMMPPNNGRDSQQPQRAPSGRPQDLFLDQPPSRGAATPDINIQNLIASQRQQRPQGPDKNSEFLLNLLQTKGSSRPPSQQARPDGNFPLWLDQPPNVPETHAPKPGRAPPPPGLFEDQLLRGHQQEPPRQEQQRMSGNDMPDRRSSQRVPPPGFYDQQEMFMQQQAPQQRRHFTEPPPHMQQPGPGRRMSGHPNLPQMQIPSQQGPPPFPPQGPEYLTSPTGPGQGPPPGFNPLMPRHPPGFANIPNIFQPPQPQPPQHGQQVPREPPGFGNMGAGGGLASPPNAPPGFYGGPHGMGPPGLMQMRSPPEGIPSDAMRGGPVGRGGFDAGFEGMQRR